MNSDKSDEQKQQAVLELQQAQSAIDEKYAKAKYHVNTRKNTEEKAYSDKAYADKNSSATTYSDFREIAKNSDDEQEVEWANEKAFNIGSSEEIQNELDQISKEYDLLENDVYGSKRDNMVLRTVYRNSYDPRNIEKLKSLKAEIDMLSNKRELANGKKYKEERFNRVEVMNNLARQDADFSKLSEYKDDGHAPLNLVQGSSAEDNVNVIYKYINDADIYKITQSQRQNDDWWQNDNRAYFTQDEIATFNYLYNTGNKEAAKTYYDNLVTTLNERMAENTGLKSTEFAEDNPFGASAYSFLTNLQSTGGIVDDIGNKISGKPVDINSKNNIYSQTTQNMREVVGEEYASNWFNGAEIPIIGNVGKWLYDTAMSTGDSAINMAIGSAVGGAIGGAAGLSAGTTSKIVSAITSTIVGSEVATQNVIEGKERGLTDSQAIIWGLASGAVEGITEKYSIDTILNNPKTVLSKIIKNPIARSFAAEGSEEIAANILDRIADEIIAGDKSQLRLQYQSYIDQGMSKNEAFNQLMIGMLSEDISSGLAGGLSGIAMYGSHKGTAKLVNKVGGVSHDVFTGKAIKNTSKEFNDNNNKKTVASHSVDNLISIGKEADTDSEIYKVASELEKQTEKRGSSDKVSNIKLSKLRSLIVDNENKSINTEIKKAYGELLKTAENDTTTVTLSDSEKAVATKLSLGESLNENENNVLYNSEALQAVENKLAESEQFRKSSDNLTRAMLSKDYALTEMQGADISSIETNGKTDNELLDEYAEAMELSDEDTKQFKDIYNPKEANVIEYANTYNIYNNYGKMAVAYDGINTKNIRSNVNESTRMAAYEAGLNARKSYYQNQNIEMKVSSVLRNSNANRGTVDISAVQKKQLNREARDMIDLAKAISTLGVNFRFIESENDKNGELHIPNGSYNRKTNTITLDINSEKKTTRESMVKGAMMYTLSHELTHLAEQNMNTYDELRLEVTKQLGTEKWEAMVERQVENLKENEAEKTEGMSDTEINEYASSEALAEACSGMLASTDFIEQIAKHNPTLGEKIIKFINNVINRFKKLLRQYDRKAEEAHVLEETVSDLESIKRKWVDAVYSGIEAVNSVQNNNTADYSGVKNQARNIVQSDFEKNVDAIEKNTYNSDNVVIMGVTPDVLQKIGLTPLPLTMTKNHIYSVAVSEARAKEEGRYSKKTNYHNLGFNAVKDIYNKISNPLMVIAHPDFANRVNRDSSHKIIVLVDLSVNGKQVIAPISIDFEAKYNNSIIDANLVSTYFNKNNINDLVKEAVALETMGKTGFYYLDKKRTQSIFKRSGYQLPSTLINSSSNIIVRKIDGNVNRKINKITQSQQFKRWFGDWQNEPEKASKAVDNNGEPLVLYHQTDKGFTAFDTKQKGSGEFDSEMPTGIFMKPTKNDIGVGGNIQMPLYASIKNPLTVNSRSDLVNFYNKNVQGYKEAKSTVNEIDNEYKIKLQEEIKKENAEYQKLWVARKNGEITEEEYQKSISRDTLDDVLEEWHDKVNEASLKAKSLIDKYFDNGKYDGLIVNNDIGSFGRSTKTFVAFKNTQVKSATDNIGTFDKNNPDIRYQYGGRKAKTAKSSLLDKAKGMESKGKSSEEIRKDTGWFRGLDRKWRFEINDSKMKYTVDWKKRLQNSVELKRLEGYYKILEEKLRNNTITKSEENKFYALDDKIVGYINANKTTLGDLVNHTELFAAYPQLKDIRVIFDYQLKTKGNYDPKINVITLNALLNEQGQKKTLVHEIQHAIQGIEGFAHGANVEYWENRLGSENYKKVYEHYFDTAGEIEARDTANRMELTAEQRKNIRPDIDRTDMVFSDADSSNQSRKAKADYKFSKALDKNEWASFYSSVQNSNQRDNLRIGDNGILIPDKNNSLNCKLVCYEGDSTSPVVTAVYKLENYDYNIHDEKIDATQTIIDCEENGYNDKQTGTVLQNYALLHNTIFKKYNNENGRFVELTRKGISNRKDDRQEPNRTGVSENAGQGISDSGINDSENPYQNRGNSLSNRDILANALESAAKTGEEVQRLRAYKEGLESLNADADRLNDVKKQIYDISFKKGSDRSQLPKLKRQKEHLESKVSRKDKALLNIEAMKPMQDLLNREKQNVSKKLVQKYTNRISDIRKEKNAKIEDERQRGIQKIKKYRADYKTSEYITKIKKLHKKLTNLALNPTKTAWVPSVLMNNGFLDVCEAITNAMDRQNGTQLSAELNKLSTKLRELMKDQTANSLYSEYFNDNFFDTMNSLVTMLDGKQIARKRTGVENGLDLQEAEAVYNVMNDIYYGIHDANKLIGKAENISVLESANSVIEEFGLLKTNKFFKAINGYEKQVLSPIRLARFYTLYNENSEMMKYINDINDASHKYNKFYMDFSKPINDFVNGVGLERNDKKERQKEYKRCLSDFIDINYSLNNGEKTTVSMTRMQGLQILMSWEREMKNENISHMRRNGVTLCNPELTSKDNIKKAMEKAIHVEVNPDLIANIQSQMTDFEETYRKLAENYFNNVSAKAINEISQIINHRNVATEKYYIPFCVDSNFLVPDMEENKFDPAITSWGNLKQLLKNAPQPIIISSLNITLEKHMKDMAKYVSFAIPTLNYKKMARTVVYAEHDIGNGEKSYVPTMSVQKAIQDAWGDNAKDFFMKQIIADVEGRIRTKDTLDGTVLQKGVAKVRTNFVNAALVMRPTVILKNFAAYSLGHLYISRKYLNVARAGIDMFTTVKHLQQTFDEVDQHTGILYMRRLGMSTQEIADMMNSKLKNMPAWRNPTKWIQGVDVVVTATLWKPCKLEIADKYRKAGEGEKVGSKEYWQDVTNLYNKVIEETQPAADSLHRAAIQKTNNEIVKSTLLMFKSDLFQSNGMMFDTAMEQVVKNTKETRKKLYRNITAQAMSWMIFAAMGFIGNAVFLHKRKPYEDKYGNMTLQSVFGKMMSEVCTQGIDLALPITGDVLQAGVLYVSGQSRYDALSIPQIETVNSAVQMWKYFNQSIESEESLEKTALDLANAIGYTITAVTGFPYKTATDLMTSIAAYISDFSGETAEIDIKPKNLAKYYGEDLLKGNPKQAKELLDKLYKQKLEEYQSDSSVKNPQSKAVTYIRHGFESAYREEYQIAVLQKNTLKMQEISKILSNCGYMKYSNSSLSAKLSEWAKSAKEESSK